MSADTTLELGDAHQPQVPLDGFQHLDERHEIGEVIG